MSAPALQRRRGRSRKPDHFHLPSVHIRNDGSGYDYEEDLYVYPEHVERVIRFTRVANGAAIWIRETHDVLCTDDWETYEEALPTLMERGNQQANDAMRQQAGLENERQSRIAAGSERACLACGCSETRSCSGGCIWATDNICSRCFL